MKIQVGKCKNNLFVILPQEVVAQLAWTSGDIVDVEVDGNDLRLVRTMTNHDHAMEIARHGMEKYRETLEALAKT
jgi:antitoxin component of MazEF toxin-antitoxin module